MCEPLPVGKFQGVKPEEFSDWENIPFFFLDVDLEYPQELHDLHNDYPLGPEKIMVGKVEKLIPTLHNKEKYVIHHKILK